MRVSAGPKATTKTARLVSARPVPKSAGRQPRTVPTASTTVSASTNSTSEARNAAVRDGSAWAQEIIRSKNAPTDAAPLRIHRLEEIGVGLRLLELVDQELEAVDRAHGHEDAAQHPHLREHGLVDQEFFLAGAGLGDVERREGALVRDLARGAEEALRALQRVRVHAAG